MPPATHSSLAEPTDSLIKALGIGAREHIAVVGAGGKSALMFALADELTKQGKKVITSTTTKVWDHQARHAPCVLCTEDSPSWKDEVREQVARKQHVFVGRCVLESGKMDGLEASALDRLFQEQQTDYLIVEADGAAGLPLKAPAEHEPVIPSSATMVVGLMGLEAIGARLDEATAFRLEAVRKITGLDLGARLTPSALARVFVHQAGVFKGTPEGARSVVLLNKADLIRDQSGAAELADILLNAPAKKIDRVILGSLKKGVYKIRDKTA